MNTNDKLMALGWRPHFAAQLQHSDDLRHAARVTAVHRDRIEIEGPAGHGAVELTHTSRRR